MGTTVYTRRYVVADPRVRAPSVALASLLRSPAPATTASSRPTVSARMLRERLQQQERDAAAAARDRRDVAVFMLIAVLATAVTFGAPILAVTR